MAADTRRKLIPQELGSPIALGLCLLVACFFLIFFNTHMLAIFQAQLRVNF